MYYNNTHARRGLGHMTARTQENSVKFDRVLFFYSLIENERLLRKKNKYKEFEMSTNSYETNKKQVLLQSKRHCALCERHKGVKIEIHHIHPRNQGGSDDLDNLIPLCFDCHQEVGSYNSAHPKGNKYSEEELKARRDDIYRKVSEGLLPIHEHTSDTSIPQDYERRLNIEKDFHHIYMIILEYDLHTPSTAFFMEVDRLTDKYTADSFFSHSHLLETLGSLGDILAIETSPTHRTIDYNNSIAQDILTLRKEFIAEYQKLFFN